MKEVVAIEAPRLNANDDVVQVNRWLIEDWEPVSPGAPIGEVESTKATTELIAESEGYFVAAAQEGEMVQIGSIIAYIASAKEPERFQELLRQQSNEDPAGDRLVSRKAQIAMAREGLTVADIPGDSIIQEKDVAAAAAAKNETTFPDDAGTIGELPVSENAIVLFGAAIQGEIVCDILADGDDLTPVAFVDDAPASARFCDLPVYRTNALPALSERGLRHIHICVGTPSARKSVNDRLRQDDWELATIRHTTAVVSRTATLGRGLFLGPQVIVGPHARIADAVQLNNAAIVAHHASIGTASVVSDGVCIGGNVSVGACCLIGLGVTINRNVEIGDNVTIVSGVSIFDSVPSNRIVRSDGQHYPALK